MMQYRGFGEQTIGANAIHRGGECGSGGECGGSNVQEGQYVAFFQLGQLCTVAQYAVWSGDIVIEQFDAIVIVAVGIVCLHTYRFNMLGTAEGVFGMGDGNHSSAEVFHVFDSSQDDTGLDWKR